MLRTDGFVGVSEYGGVYKKGLGRAENINYLLPKGAKFLAENTKGLDIGKIHYPKNIDGIFRNDYLHRISTVNTEIAFETWAQKQGFEVVFFDTYFHKVGSAKTSKDNNPLRSLTRVTFADGSFIEPDAIFAYDTEKKRQFMILEVSNGVDTTRIVDQLKKVIEGVVAGLFTKLYQQQYDIHISPRVLCTVEDENMLRLVLKRINADAFFSPVWMQQAFFLQVAEKVWENCGDGWVNMKGATINLAQF
jgi:hypothetical protein